MLNDFEVKMSPESDWELRQVTIYNDISFSNINTTNEKVNHHSFTSIPKSPNNNFSISHISDGENDFLILLYW